MIAVALISRGRWPRMGSDLIRYALVTRLRKLPTILAASTRKKVSLKTISLNTKPRLSIRKMVMLLNRKLSRSKLTTSRWKTRVEVNPRTSLTTLTT